MQNTTKGTQLAAAFAAALDTSDPSTPKVAFDENDDRELEFNFQIKLRHAPAFRSLLEEFAKELSGRVEGRFATPTERALTDALICLGKLRACVYAQVPAGDPAYRERR